jgi:hypothetical protein
VYLKFRFFEDFGEMEKEFYQNLIEINCFPVDTDMGDMGKYLINGLEGDGVRVTVEKVLTKLESWFSPKYLSIRANVSQEYFFQGDEGLEVIRWKKALEEWIDRSSLFFEEKLGEKLLALFFHPDVNRPHLHFFAIFEKEKKFDNFYQTKKWPFNFTKFELDYQNFL